jgi:hypothetical protein|tara:strand:- start:58818 stop:59558 length:741 start_codon:yes stop_codon:yes gene_type:complete
MSEKKGGFFNKLMNLVSEEVPENGTPVKQTKNASAKAEAIPTQTLDFETSVPERFRSKSITPSASAVRGGFNEEFYNHLQEEIKKNDLEGADYYEFRKTYEVLSKSMPEVQALNASFQALSAMSPDLTVDHLLKTANFYLDLVNKEHDGFEDQFNDKITTEIHGRQSAIEAEDELQANMLNEIQVLENLIQESQNKVQGIQNEKDVEENKLNGVKANWDFTIELVKNNINTDIDNIGKHLVGTKTV